ncbi:MAG: hypothetical protein FOGNACKC_06261 [Anaerolineae bacterium]|nr:hypothetical protein [Anaerolineae bacterium]
MNNLVYIVALVVPSLIAFAIEWPFFQKQDNEPGSFFSRRSSQIRIAGLIFLIISIWLLSFPDGVVLPQIVGPVVLTMIFFGVFMGGFITPILEAFRFFIAAKLLKVVDSYLIFSGLVASVAINIISSRLLI